MQSIFRLPWCSDPLGGDHKSDIASFQARSHAPAVDIPLLNKLKRKRSDTTDVAACDNEVKRKRPCETEVRPLRTELSPSAGGREPQQAPAPGHAPIYTASDLNLTGTADVDAPAMQAPKVRADDGAPLVAAAIVPSLLTPVQQAIEHQFNLEILLKHRELRLIDQELAKCQVALEQLRRCQIMPFPGTAGLDSDISCGVGPAVRAQPGSSQPVAPAPWGVTDGPYSRHYADWLLPDPTFDSVSPAQYAATQESFSGPRGDGRPTRNTGVGWAKPTKRAHRDSVNSFSAQSAIHAPAPARNKNGPLVLKRMSDNQFVKLVCTKCHRSDFSSVQGFLNHCRIAHKIDYKSHEAAAQDCGHVLEDHESDLAATAPPPVGSTVRVPAPKPTSLATPKPAPAATRVHQFNQDVMPRPTWKRQRLAYIQALEARPREPIQTTTASFLAAQQSPLVPSSATPFLSAQMARRGMGLDLASIVAMCCEKIELDREASEEVDDSQASLSPVASHSNSAMRVTTGGKTGGDRPVSRKGFNQAGQRPRPSPLTAPLARPVNSHEVPESPRENLSPNTADSNPGLVSDHEDDPVSDTEETGSVGDPVNTIALDRGCGDGMDVDVDLDDSHDGHAVIIRSRGSRSDESVMRDGGSPSRPRSKYGRGQ